MTDEPYLPPKPWPWTCARERILPSMIPWAEAHGLIPSRVPDEELPDEEEDMIPLELDR